MVTRKVEKKVVNTLSSSFDIVTLVKRL